MTTATLTVEQVITVSTATPPPDFSGFVGYYYNEENQTGRAIERQTVK
jgi:hypothetical protein